MKNIIIAAVTAAALVVVGCATNRPGQNYDASMSWTPEEIAADPQGYSNAHRDYHACSMRFRQKVREDATKGQGALAALSFIPGFSVIPTALTMGKMKKTQQTAAKSADECMNFLKHPSRR